jgi:hypothetical protein
MIECAAGTDVIGGLLDSIGEYRITRVWRRPFIPLTIPARISLQRLGQWASSPSEPRYIAPSSSSSITKTKTTASTRLFPSSADTNLLMWPNGRIAHHPATRRTIGLRLWLVWRAKFLLGFRVRLTHRWREQDSNPWSLSGKNGSNGEPGRFYERPMVRSPLPRRPGSVLGVYSVAVGRPEMVVSRSRTL